MNSGTVEEMLADQGIELAAGRAEKIAPAVNALNAQDPLRAKLAFEIDPTSYVVQRARLK
jgi:hypothetical protein